MKYFYLPFFLLMAGLVPLSRGVCQKSPSSVLHRASLYGVVDLSFKVKSPVLSPFDIPFGGVFTDESGATLTVPGFYNGANEYILRFSPTRKGRWTYRTYSSEAQLSGQHGEVIADENNASPGGVVVSPDSPQKFMYQNGAPYFALAFELDWLFALDYDNPAGLPKTESLIREIKANGFNQVVMNVYAYDVKWKVAPNVPARYDFRRPGYSPFGGTNEKPDFSTLNVAFFQHFDRVIQHLNEQGIVAHLMIYVWNKGVSWPAMYSPADNRYFDYIIRRYQAYSNIIWDVSKEALDYGRCDIPYINERIARIRRQDAYQRLITVHDYEYCSREADRVDFISIQNWRSDLYSLSLEAYLRHSDKPVMNIEHGGYEEGPYESFTGNYVNPEACLIRNYECIFAGVYSTYYWQDTSWNVVIYDPMNPGHHFPRPRFDYYRHLQDFFTRYKFNNLFPHKPKLTTNSREGIDNFASSGYPLTDGQGMYLYLVPAANYQINVVLPKPPAEKLAAIWFNPFTGEYKDEGFSPWGSWKGYQSPWKGAYSILILKAL